MQNFLIIQYTIQQQQYTFHSPHSVAIQLFSFANYPVKILRSKRTGFLHSALHTDLKPLDNPISILNAIQDCSSMHQQAATYYSALTKDLLVQISTIYSRPAVPHNLINVSTHLRVLDMQIVFKEYKKEKVSSNEKKVVNDFRFSSIYNDQFCHSFNLSKIR